MPRAKRIHIPGAFYFVSTSTNPGNQLSKRSDDDWEQLNREVNDALGCFDAWAHAFCWTPEQLYLFVQVGRIPLGRVLQRFKSNFSLYQHEKTQTKGNWFEQRYRAMLVDENDYFRHVVRYIHLQPLSMGLAKHIDDYPWCSHRDYLGQASFSRLRADQGLARFDANAVKARSAYERFVALPLEREGPFLNTLPPCTALDPRILGSYEFSQRVLGRFSGRAPKATFATVAN